MKALVCLLLVPAAVAVWILGSPRTAWRVIAAFRHRGPDARPPGGMGYTILRAGATLTLASIVVLIILTTQGSD